MLFPSADTLCVEILFACPTVFKRLIVLVHLREAYHTVLIVLQVNIFAIFFRIHVFQSAPQSFFQLIVKHLVCVFWYRCTVPEVIQNFFVLSHLSYDEVNVFTWLFLKCKIHARALHSKACGDFVVFASSSLNNKVVVILLSFCTDQKDSLIFTFVDSVNCVLSFCIFFWLCNFVFFFCWCWLLRFGLVFLDHDCLF